MVVDIAIVFALEEEFEQLYRHIADGARVEQDHKTHRAFVLFEHPVPGAAPYRCVTSFVGSMGIPDALHFTSLLLERYRPLSVVVVGLAGSLSDDVRIGDLVVADQIVEYMQDGKVTPTELLPSDRSYRAHAQLKHTIQYLRLTHRAAWAELGRQSIADLGESVGAELLDRAGAVVRRDEARIHIGHIASGPVVGASAAFADWLRGRDRKFLALEMETAGVMNAVYQNAGGERVLVIRAISDLSDERKAAMDGIRGGALRGVAMRNAVRLLQAIMTAGQLERHPDAAPAPAPPPRPAAPVIAAPASIADLLARLSNADPLICLPAADELGRSAVDPIDVLDAASLEPVRAYAARRVIGAIADRAAPVIEGALASGSWGKSVRAAELCAPELAPRIARRIAEPALKRGGEIDHNRVRILALGRLVSSEHAFHIADLVEDIADDSDLFQKYESYCVEALAQIFARCVERPDDGHDPRATADRVAFDYTRAMDASLKGSGEPNRHALSRNWFHAACGPIQADVALARYAKSPLVSVRIDAARIVGYARFARGVDWLAQVVKHDDAVRSRAAWALAMIDGPRSLNELAHHDAHDEVRGALAMRSASSRSSG